MKNGIDNPFKDDGSVVLTEPVPEYTYEKPLKKGKGYKLAGVRDFHGLTISVEHNKGGIRKGVDKDGHEWETKMHYAYGGIRNTKGADGEYVDVYIGDDTDSSLVFIVHQNDPVTHNYDEDKCMIQFSSAEEAKKAYLKQYDRPGFFGSMDQVTVEEFIQMLKDHKGVKLKKSMTISPDELMKAYNSASTMTVTGTDCTFKEFLKPFLEYIQKIGGSGHSFSIVVDPDDSENRKVFGFDGDGADRIDTIKVVTPTEKSGVDFLEVKGLLSLYKVSVRSPESLLKQKVSERSPKSLLKVSKGLADELEQEGAYVEGQPKVFTAEQVQQGIRVEMEHTDDVEIAKQIAYDHLAENPDYYSYLEGMEEEMERRDSLGKAKQDDKFELVMREFKKGTLHSSDGKIVTDREQALAIAYSESGMSKSGVKMKMKMKMILRKSGDESKFKKYKKALLDFLQGDMKKSRGYSTGTIREWQGKNYKKMASGKWMRVYAGGQKDRGMDQAVKNTIKKIEKATTMEELVDIVRNSQSRFKGAGGYTAEVVKDLMGMARGTEAGKKTGKGEDSTLKQKVEAARKKHGDKWATMSDDEKDEAIGADLLASDDKSYVKIRSDTPGNEKWTVSKGGKKFDVNKTKNGWRVAESGGGAPSILGSKFADSPEEAVSKHVEGSERRKKKTGENKSDKDPSVSDKIKAEYSITVNGKVIKVQVAPMDNPPAGKTVVATISSQSKSEIESGLAKYAKGDTEFYVSKTDGKVYTAKVLRNVKSKSGDKKEKDTEDKSKVDYDKFKSSPKAKKEYKEWMGKFNEAVKGITDAKEAQSILGKLTGIPTHVSEKFRAEYGVTGGTTYDAVKTFLEKKKDVKKSMPDTETKPLSEQLNW